MNSRFSTSTYVEVPTDSRRYKSRIRRFQKLEIPGEFWRPHGRTIVPLRKLGESQRGAVAIGQLFGATVESWGGVVESRDGEEIWAGELW